MIRRVFVIAVLVATVSTVQWDREQKREKICDDGSYLIEKDLGGRQNWQCQGNTIVIETVSAILRCQARELSALLLFLKFYTPSGYASCQDPQQVSE